MTTATAPRERGFESADIARIAVFAALIGVLGLPGSISIGGAVPITAQTLGVMLAGAVLGARRGALAVIALLVLVAIGLPLLSGGRGGLGAFVGPSAGYLFGWIAGAAVIGLVVRLGAARPRWWRVALGAVVGGIGVIYLFGVPVQSMVTGLGLWETIVTSLVFLPGDLVKAALTVIITMALWKAYPRAFAWPRRAPSEPIPAGAPSEA
ncbi:biotin transporter BioY [Gulosibacter sp. 10]|uniref:biotin transporter BioY n=1 Tax=Gulosibacter sp. 10 TaxID=1255570 RepID=UPI00097E9D04|nr:biotin transporter BioY [Gulosibacter sp. 10]SJM53161.1 Substrate-specific component BioY of biotin ECF transporter [Gulosibacter sp. 10]